MERGGINPEGLRDEDPEARTVVAVLFLSSLYSSYSPHLFIKFSVLREGVCRGTRGGHISPAPLLLNLGRSNEDAVPQKEDRAGPETQMGDVCNHKAPADMGVDIVTLG